MKKRIILGCIVVLLAGLFAGCGKEEGKDEAISVYLWSADMMMEYAPYIQSQLPDVEIEFVVGNNDLDFYKFMKENGSLPDIITNRRFSLYDAQGLQDQLMDLSSTEEAGSIYLSYLENYMNPDGTVNWLPLCGEADGFIANQALFDKYNIPLPTDYESFVAACKAFKKQGIRGFVSDFDYDYTCMEILQGLSIPDLTSMDGQVWRQHYENPADEEMGLDDKGWPGIFERMEQFIEDAEITPEDITLRYETVQKMFNEGKAAMIRGTGTQVISFDSEEAIAPVFLPYFGQNGEEWLLTYPAFQVALNKDLEQEEEKKEQAFRILNVMLSQEGQNVLAKKKDVLPYSKNVELELTDDLSNLKPYIEENYLYVRMASNDFFSVSRDVVQKMILGEYDAKQAYEAFDTQLRQTEEKKEEKVVSFEKGYSNEFREKGGNEAASVMANTLREYYGSDVLVAPAYSFTGSVLKADYTEKNLGYMVMPNVLAAWHREMTGEELKAYLKASVEGEKGTYRPFNRSSLPTVSGISIEVKEGEGGTYTLTRVLADGKELEDKTVYQVTVLNTQVYLNDLMPYLYPKEGIEAFTMEELKVRESWVEYVRSGGSLAKPTDYITLK